MQTLFYRLGGTLLVVGALLPLFSSAGATYVFSIGALLFAYAQITESYEGRNIIIRRLRRQQIIGASLLIVTGALMFTSLYHVSPFTGREWMITFLIATVLELYTILRIEHEEGKEKR